MREPAGATAAARRIWIGAAGTIGLALLVGSISVTAAGPASTVTPARELSGSAGAAQSSTGWSGYVATSLAHLIVVTVPLGFVTLRWSAKREARPR